MKTHTKIPQRLALVAVLALALALPTAALAQSDLDTSEAEGFLGNWSLSMESPQGEFVMALDITDSSGKVAASISNDFTGNQDVTDISRSGDDLVLRYEVDAQGQVAPVALTLSPDGDALNASMDFADGMFVMEGRATK
jgi:hypothetical protein